jgi:hypothetical protein
VIEEKGELRKEFAAVREKRKRIKWQAEEADWMERMKMIEENIVEE